METFTDQDLIKELQAFHPPIENRTGGFTQKEWAEAQNMDIYAASKQIRGLEEEGKLIMKRQRCDGRVRNVYYKSDNM